MSVNRRLTFLSGALQLEGILHLPKGTGRRSALLVCHPHPLYGGAMQNNVVSAVCSAVAGAGWAALRFNFRGVGDSQGAYGDGIGEQEDVLAAIRHLGGLPEIDTDHIVVGGYSFGAWAGLAAAASQDAVAALIAISPPIPSYDFGFLNECSKPKLLLYGDRDGYVDRSAAESCYQSMPDPKQRRIFPGVDHFWLARERPLTDAILDFLRCLPDARERPA